MRVKRTVKFKKIKNRQIRNLVLYVLILPCTSVLLGYLITTVLILPSMAR